MTEARWTKRVTSAIPFTRELAAGVIRYLHAPKAQDKTDAAQKDEF